MLNIFGIPMDPVSQLTTFFPTVLTSQTMLARTALTFRKASAWFQRKHVYISHMYSCYAFAHPTVACVEETPMQLVFQYICQVAKYIRYAKLNSAFSCWSLLTGNRGNPTRRVELPFSVSAVERFVPVFVYLSVFSLVFTCPSYLRLQSMWMVLTFKPFRNSPVFNILRTNVCGRLTCIT